MLLYGQNRVGKTTLACQFPKPLLLIAFEPSMTGGALSITKVPGVKVLVIKTYDDAVRLARELEGDSTFKTHVLDSATSFQELSLASVMDLASAPIQLDWGLVSRDQYRYRAEKTKAGLDPFLKLKVNTVVIAKERDHNPPDKERPKMLRGFGFDSFLAADLGGATAGWLNDNCDYVTRLSIEKEVRIVKMESTIGGKKKITEQEEETGKDLRRLQTKLKPNSFAGFRSASPGALPEFLDEPTYDKILKLIQG